MCVKSQPLWSSKPCSLSLWEGRFEACTLISSFGCLLNKLFLCWIPSQRLDLLCIGQRDLAWLQSKAINLHSCRGCSDYDWGTSTWYNCVISLLHPRQSSHNHPLPILVSEHFWVSLGMGKWPNVLVVLCIHISWQTLFYGSWWMQNADGAYTTPHFSHYRYKLLPIPKSRLTILRFSRVMSFKNPVSIP